MADTDDNPSLWATTLGILASQCVTYAPGIARHDPALARMMTMTGLRLGLLLDRLDGHHEHAQG